MLPHPRDPDPSPTRSLTFVRQRLYGLCLGYEDLNDQDHLRRDLAWQTAAERDEPLAQQSDLVPVGEPGGPGDRMAGAGDHSGAVHRFVCPSPGGTGAGL